LGGTNEIKLHLTSSFEVDNFPNSVGYNITTNYFPNHYHILGQCVQISIQFQQYGY